MTNIMLKYRLENKSDGNIVENNITAMKQNNMITYNENNVIVSMEINSYSLSIVRRCSEYELVIILVSNEISNGIYNIHNVGTFDLLIKTKILEFSNNKIYAEYELTVNEEISKFVFSLEYEEIL